MLSACTNAQGVVPRFDYPVSNRVALTPSVVNVTKDKRVVQVSIENNGAEVICLTRDSIQNPNSFEMQIYVRDKSHRILDQYDFGFVVPPLEGEIRLEVGQSIEAKYNLDTRVAPALDNSFFRKNGPLELLTIFDTRLCSDRTYESSTSGWVPVEIQDSLVGKIQ